MTLSTIVEQLEEAKSRNLIQDFSIQHYTYNIYYDVGITIHLHTERHEHQLGKLLQYFRTLGFYATALGGDKLLVQVDENFTTFR